MISTLSHKQKVMIYTGVCSNILMNSSLTAEDIVAILQSTLVTFILNTTKDEVDKKELIEEVLTLMKNNIFRLLNGIEQEINNSKTQPH